MLVLSRRVGQEIVLPSCGITVTVIRVSGKRVSLGVEAPAETPVHRAEKAGAAANSHEQAKE